jgi:serine/threonine protein kinase
VQLFSRIAQAVGGAGPRIGKYRVVRRLAQGGMGEIFIARANGRGGFEKTVVLKRILQQNAGDRDAVQMFMDEARLMAALNHPNIVQVYDFGTAAGGHFFAMEYVHGEDLGRIMKAATLAGRTLPLDLSLGVIAEAAAGLHYAHEKRGDDGAPLQIVHRDISPSNLLVSYDGAVKLTDFGIAKWSQRQTETRYGALKGKIAYMSPEQCRGGPLDRRSDVFGLGILLYELTTGTRLYQGASDFGVLEQIVNQDPPPPSSRRRDYPVALERIVLRALSRAPERRQETARALQQELEEYALEARLKLSSVGRATEMQALFGHKPVGEAGPSHQPERTGRTITRPEMTAGEHFESTQPVTAPADPAAPVSRRRGIAVAAVAMLAAGVAYAAIERRPAPAPPPPVTVAPAPAPAVAPPPPAATPSPAAAAAPAAPRPRVVARPARERPAHRTTRRPPAASRTAAEPSGKKIWNPDSIFLP